MSKRVLLAAPRGYCAGVDRAVVTVEKALELYGAPIYVRKEIVHNKHVVSTLEERGVIFSEVGADVYEGMVIGENSRPEDMDVNAVREKKLTNIRSAGADEMERLIPPKILNMEQALEFCREDECIEVTPTMVRVRKVIFDGNERARLTSKAKK
ncbi:MAG: hypothetical protein RLZZ19_926, partial [Actinomycetota bacterium]